MARGLEEDAALSVIFMLEPERVICFLWGMTGVGGDSPASSQSCYGVKCEGTQRPIVIRTSWPKPPVNLSRWRRILTCLCVNALATPVIIQAVPQWLPRYGSHTRAKLKGSEVD